MDYGGEMQKLQKKLLAIWVLEFFPVIFLLIVSFSAATFSENNERKVTF